MNTVRIAKDMERAVGIKSHIAYKPLSVRRGHPFGASRDWGPNFHNKGFAPKNGVCTHMKKMFDAERLERHIYR